MRLLITRPQEDAAPLVDILKAQGYEPVLFPLLKIENDKEGAEKLASFKVKDIQALIVTSANGVRAFAECDKRRSFKVMAVGDASARAAREAGFKTVESASGDVETLAGLIKEKCDPKKGTFLHIAGSKVAGNLKGLLETDGFVYERVVLYSAEKVTAFSDALIEDIKTERIDGVLLYSPRTAVSFIELLDKAGLKNHVKNMVAYGLSAAVASKLQGVDFKEVITAASPDQEALLACLPQFSRTDAMTAKKDDNKKEDAKVIEAKAEDVKVEDAPKPDDKKDTATKPTSKMPETKKADPKKTEPEKAKEDKKAEDPVEKALKEKADQPVKKKGSFKAKLMVASVVILAGAGVAGYYTQDIWVPQAKKKIVEILKLESVMAKGASNEQLAALTARLDALESKPAPKLPQPIDVQPLLDKIAGLESALAAVKSDVSAVNISNGSDEKLEEFKALADRLESAQSSGGADISALKTENKKLSQLVSELNNRLAGVEAARLEVQSVGSNVQALVAAISALREVVRTSSSYEAELKTLSVLAQGDSTLEDGVAALKSNAVAGLASTTSLITSFEKTANDIVRALAIPEGAGWVEETVKNVTSLVSIRRAPGNIEGEGALGTVARAELNVRNGDLAGAIAELKTLEGKPLEAAQGWIGKASSRLAADKTLSQMQAHILSLMTSNGGQG